MVFSEGIGPYDTRYDLYCGAFPNILLTSQALRMRTSISWYLTMVRSPKSMFHACFNIPAGDFDKVG